MIRSDQLAPLAVVTRSGREESWHFGAVAIVVDGALWRAFGDAELRVYARSAVKPMQALPVLELGLAERFGLTDAELAVLGASHNGTDAHIAAVRRILHMAELTEADLGCGPHLPFDRAAARALAGAGARPQRVHNNCSGKHAGFLLLARELGVPLPAYLDADSRAQRRVRATVAAMAGVGTDDLEVGLDGCGAPTLRMPLSALALAFWRLANPAHLDGVRAAACRRLLGAITREPVLLAGEGRLCTALIRSAPGRIYPKNGAEGVYAAGLVGAHGDGVGIAIKVADGHDRAYFPVVVDVLQRLGLWSAVPAELAPFQRTELHNTQKVLVGHVESALAW